MGCSISGVTMVAIQEGLHLSSILELDDERWKRATRCILIFVNLDMRRSVTEAIKRFAEVLWCDEYVRIFF